MLLLIYSHKINKSINHSINQSKENKFQNKPLTSRLH